jgi:hypothetical protein
MKQIQTVGGSQIQIQAKFPMSLSSMRMGIPLFTSKGRRLLTGKVVGGTPGEIMEKTGWKS